MLDFSKLRLTQPSLAGSGAELGNKVFTFLDELKAFEYLSHSIMCSKQRKSSNAASTFIHILDVFMRPNIMYM
jgi:hypothetical protein